MPDGAFRIFTYAGLLILAVAVVAVLAWWAWRARRAHHPARSGSGSTPRGYAGEPRTGPAPPGSNEPAGPDRPPAHAEAQHAPQPEPPFGQHPATPRPIVAPPVAPDPVVAPRPLYPQPLYPQPLYPQPADPQLLHAQPAYSQPGYRAAHRLPAYEQPAHQSRLPPGEPAPPAATTLPTTRRRSTGPRTGGDAPGQRAAGRDGRLGRMDYRRSFQSAAVSFADLVSRLPADRWDGTGLGDWTLRDLVGHTVSSALRQVPTALATPAEAVALESAEAYWSLARTVPPEVYAAHTAASGRDAQETGRALGDDPATQVSELVGRATQALAAVGDDDVIATAAGGMRVRDWLPTRTFELVVHGQDAADAAGVGYVLAPGVIAEAAAQAARVAAAAGDGPLLLRALTGRAALPEKYSII